MESLIAEILGGRLAHNIDVCLFEKWTADHFGEPDDKWLRRERERAAVNLLNSLTEIACRGEA